MDLSAGVVIAITLAYFLVLVIIGIFATRSTQKTPEDYFMASRGFGWFVLLMSIFGTNMTAYYMMGVPAQAYRQGLGLYGYVALGCAIIATGGLYIIGYRAWLVGRKYGYMTQSEVFGARWDSRAVSVVLFIIMIIYTIPYLTTSIIGAANAIEALTSKAIPYAWGALITTLVVSLYTANGGMRGTTWTNVFQTLLFMSVAIITFILIGAKMGGFAAATEKVLAVKPQLLQRAGNFTPKDWFSYFFIAPLAVIAFPQVFVRVLTGRTVESLRRLVITYPVVFFLAWPPVIFIGVWGTVAFPDLQGKAVDAIFPMMVGKYLPAFFKGLGLAGVLAAIMSSMDAMMLTVSNMLTNDIIQPYRQNMSAATKVWLGRLFVWAFAALAFIGALIRPGTIFAIASYAFTGFSAITPVFVLGLYWRRSNKYGALAGLIVPAVLLPFYFAKGTAASLKWSTFGFSPIIPLMVIATVLTVVVSLITPPAPEAATRRFFDIFDRTYGRVPAKAPAAGATVGH